jgi:hypothetical protein
MRSAHSRISPPKKNLILSAERLRRVWDFFAQMRRAAARHLGGAASSSYFENRPPKFICGFLKPARASAARPLRSSANQIWWSLYQKVRTHFKRNPI